jgi:hypothetical protein
MELTTDASRDAPPDEPAKRKTSKHKILIIDITNIPNTTHSIITYGKIKSRVYCKNG